MTAPEPPPQTILMQMITGHWVSAAVHAAASLGVADHIQDPTSTEALAAATGAHETSLFRLMRALASLGVFEETAPRTFGLTPLGELLRTDAPRSLRDMVLFQGAPPHWRGWGSFLHSIRTGESAFAHVHGQGFFDYCEQDAEFGRAFNGAMTGISAGAADAVVEAYDFGSVRRLVDVGGGHGMLLTRILQRYPDLQGVVFDLPHVVEGAKGPLTAAGLDRRCQVVGGDFFEEVPAGDAVILKHIIHDWDDARARQILERAAAALEPNGRVLLVEGIIPPGNDPHFGKILDLEMLHATPGGKERTAEEFAALFESAGLTLARTLPTQSPYAILEAVKA